LETERLYLRPVDPQRDFEQGWSRLLTDEENARYLGGVSTRAGAWRSMCVVLGHWQIHGFGFLSVEEKATGDWVGWAGPWHPEGWPGREIGWSMLKDYWGRGYAPEAAAAAMKWAFRGLGWDRVVHVIDPENAASIRVAEKLGSYKIGHEPDLAGVGMAVDVYGQTREEWRQTGRG